MGKPLFIANIFTFTGFLDDKNTLADIGEILDLMSASEVCALAHEHNIYKNEMGEKLSKKSDFSSAIIKLGNKQKNLFSYFSPNSKHSMKTSIIQRLVNVEVLSVAFMIHKLDQ